MNKFGMSNYLSVSTVFFFVSIFFYFYPLLSVVVGRIRTYNEYALVLLKHEESYNAYLIACSSIYLSV